MSGDRSRAGEKRCGWGVTGYRYLVARKREILPRESEALSKNDLSSNGFEIIVSFLVLFQNVSMNDKTLTPTSPTKDENRSSTASCGWFALSNGLPLVSVSIVSPTTCRFAAILTGDGPVTEKPLEVLPQLLEVFGRGPVGTDLVQVYCRAVEAAQPREAQPVGVRVLPRLDEGTLDSAHLERYVIGELDVEAELRIGSRPGVLGPPLVQ